MSNKPPLGGEDPLIHITERDLVDEKAAEFSAKLGDKLITLEKEGLLSINSVESVLIFGPGLADTQAVYSALRSSGRMSPNIHIDVVEGDIRVQSEIGFQQSVGNLPDNLTFWNESFSEFLGEPRPEDVSADLVIVHDTGPSTTRPGVGISDDLITPLANCIKSNGLIITSGETHELDDYLASSPYFKKIETAPEDTTSARGFTVWQKL